MSTKLTIVEQLDIWQKRMKVSNNEMASILGVTSQNYLRRKRLNSFTSAELELIVDRLGLVIEFAPK